MNFVFRLHESAVNSFGVLVGQADVFVQRAKQRDPFAEQDGNDRDNQFVDQSRSQKTLNRNPAVDVEFLCSFARQSSMQFLGDSEE